MTDAELSPGPLLAMSDAYWKSCALHAAVALDVFSPLAAAPLTAEQLAGRLGVDERALGMLLGAMRALGLLTRAGEAFALVPLSAAYLVRSAPEYKGYMILHHKHLVESFAHLDQAVRTGRSVRTGPQRTAAEREAFLLGMFNNAMGIAPRLALMLDSLLTRAGLPGMAGRSRLLDLGGGPGTYAIHFCLAHPGLEAVVYDMPTTRPFAEATAGRFGLAYAREDGPDEARLRFAPGDYTRDAVPGGFDLAWLSHILHGEAPEVAAEVVRKAADGLKPGGLLLVHEFLLDDTLDGPEFPALFSLNMLLGTPGGQSYSGAQVRAMLAAAGLTDIVRLDFSGPNSSGVIAGRKA
jgi:SAM-dependent methyltransferase